jgi:hypothetical protein
MVAAEFGCIRAREQDAEPKPPSIMTARTAAAIAKFI